MKAHLVDGPDFPDTYITFLAKDAKLRGEL
jgi:hypothetical protein